MVKKWCNYTYIALPSDKQLVRSLKGFKRIFLKAGESKTVEFNLSCR
jgi:hypothetical protein